MENKEKLRELFMRLIDDYRYAENKLVDEYVIDVENRMKWQKITSKGTLRNLKKSCSNSIKKGGGINNPLPNFLIYYVPYSICLSLQAPVW